MTKKNFWKRKRNFKVWLPNPLLTESLVFNVVRLRLVVPITRSVDKAKAPRRIKIQCDQNKSSAIKTSIGGREIRFHFPCDQSNVIRKLSRVLSSRWTRTQAALSGCRSRKSRDENAHTASGPFNFTHNNSSPAEIRREENIFLFFNIGDGMSAVVAGGAGRWLTDTHLRKETNQHFSRSV